MPVYHQSNYLRHGGRDASMSLVIIWLDYTFLLRLRRTGHYVALKHQCLFRDPLHFILFTSMR